jgi:uncharacterized protein YndB with AHSA1/START domain
MSKKKVIKKPVKKAAKPSKGKKIISKPASKAAKKAKPVKAAKSAKPKKAVKPAKKSVAKKVTKKIVSKKTVIKKAVKAVKKATKSAKPSNLKKNIKSNRPVVKSAAKTNKTVKKSVSAEKKKATKAAPKKAVKSVKKVQKPLAKKVVKPVVLVKSVKSKPVGKSAVKELAAKTLKGSKEKELEKKDKLKAVKPELPKAEKVKPPRRSKKSKKAKDDDDEPAIEIDPLIEEIIRSTKKKVQQPKKPKIIQTFVNPMASLAVALPADNGKKSAQPKKEPKGKFELEYVIRTSAGILYEFLTSPSGLSEWFADDVNIRDGIFTFYWDGSEQKARLLNFKDEKFVRMQWIDKPEGSYFEFKIEKDELTGDISLIITDFADEGSDLETSKRLWDSQVNKLLHVIGSY